MSKVLLRTNPTTIDQAMTPLPATILNGLLTTLNTKIKTPSEQHNTILVQKGGPSPASNTHPYLDFITESNKVVRYILDTGAYSVLSLPAGVNPVSLVTFYCQYTPSYGYTLDGLYILGDDGKIYLTFTYPTAAGQSGTVSTYANSVWGTTNFPFVTQITFTTDNNLAFLANGKIGALLPQSSAVPVYAYPLPYQSGTTKQILFTQYVNSAMTGYNNSLSFTKSQDDLFRIYDAQPSHATTKNAYNITPLGNYFNDTSYTYSGGTSDKFLIYTEFHPSKCVSY
jgi:hypothetical protein